MEYHYGDFIIDENEFCKLEYKCDPDLCKNNVCCMIFDIAITFEERDRIIGLYEKLLKYCPWLTEDESPFQLTPSELFIRKRPDGLCWFNFRDEQGRCWCALHAAALDANENPFAWKPLNCSLWPFLRDGQGRLEVDMHTRVPCLKFNAGKIADKELLSMLESIASAIGESNDE